MQKKIASPRLLLVKAIYIQNYAKTLDSFLWKALLIILSIMIIAGAARAQQFNSGYFNNVDGKGVILDGYDPGCFFY
jgi:hypothetical protein